MAGDPYAQLAQADKLASSASGGFSFFGGKTTKLEDAARLYKSAGDDLFNDKGAYQEAAQAYEKAAAIYRDQLKETIEMADCYDKASKAYRKSSPPDCARLLQNLIDFRKSEGEFRRATKPQQELAELYETDLNQPPQAITAWETAGRWYENDRAESLANKCYLKVADLSALAEDYGTAIRYLEQVAKGCVNNNLMRFSVKEYLLKAGICHLASKDMVGTNRALESYRQMDPSFVQQREHQLLVDLAEKVEQNDGEGFSDKLFQYDQMSKLDQWKTTMLLRVKNNIGEMEDDFS
ncbi:MAG: hypothetical protein Q9162_000138 [Coniocarpon cinnabarinum]